MSTRSGFPVIVLVLLVTCSVAEQATEFAEASDGGTATLACSLISQNSDKISNILWYRGAEETPIYKYDARNAHAQHWAESDLKNRFFLRVLDDARAVMTITPTKHEDENIYHCRVDFLQSPTKITHVNLTVIVPPTNVQISDSFGPIKNGVTSSYAEGASITLTCLASGGKPLAKVSWWRDGELVTEETHYSPDRAKSQSVLKIEKLTRSHLLAVYSCEVSNSRLQPPLVVRVAIDMYLRPLEVILIGNNPEFSATRSYNITCKSRGSRPPAIVTWWKDGQSLEGGVVSVSADGNTTTSVMSFTPTAADHGLVLACKASNQRIPFSEMQRTWMLKVLYPPKVSITLGRRLDATDVKEGADVYFECHLIANPWVRYVWWLRDGDRLHNNATAGIIVSNQTLVLQGVSRASSGKYSCQATNSEGTGNSPTFHLRVKYEPVCRDGPGRKVVGAAKDEPVHIECKVEAEPPPTSFRWSFNSTPGISKDITSHIDSERSSDGSVLTYVPHSTADYGTIQCWGTNEIGLQRASCTYLLVPAGRPDPPSNCGLTNVTHHSVVVECQRGFDGGIKQKFLLILHSGDTTVTNISSIGVPEFYIPNLEPAQGYYATIYSFNSKGSAKYPQPVLIRTLPAPGLKELRRSTEPSDLPNRSRVLSGPWLYIMLAAGSTLIVAAVVGIIIFVIRRFKIDSPARHPRPSRNVKQRHQEETPLGSLMQPIMTDSLTEDDNNPDLIPPPTYDCLQPLQDTSTLPPYTITARPHIKRNCATQMPVKPYHVTWAPILQSRNTATQTPQGHKESSV